MPMGVRLTHSNRVKGWCSRATCLLGKTQSHKRQGGPNLAVKPFGTWRRGDDLHMVTCSLMLAVKLAHKQLSETWCTQREAQAGLPWSLTSSRPGAASYGVGECCCRLERVRLRLERSSGHQAPGKEEAAHFSYIPHLNMPCHPCT